MKKLLLLLAVAGMVGCSKDDDNSKAELPDNYKTLTGRWVAYKKYSAEIENDTVAMRETVISDNGVTEYRSDMAYIFTSNGDTTIKGTYKIEADSIKIVSGNIKINRHIDTLTATTLVTSDSVYRRPFVGCVGCGKNYVIRVWYNKIQ